ncbi:hypothetical protein DFH08DRAFT_799959 [Mycena albidolilacea]|uniref:Uncharacterized protein n=1 Tax=Mycena albidolilacea TaxID=1033008 RepID=A0AAD7AMP9_9AGAR|nr:hypothetical protein DFH08DRAFT_799959 [Mycena albidolilacea]
MGKEFANFEEERRGKQMGMSLHGVIAPPRSHFVKERLIILTRFLGNFRNCREGSTPPASRTHLGTTSQKKARENGESSNVLDVNLKGEEYEEYKDSLSKEERVDLIAQLVEYKVVKEHGICATNKAVALDTMQNTNEIEQINNLYAHTSVRAFLMFSHGHPDNPAMLRFVDSDNAHQLFQDTSVYDLVRKYELWCINLSRYKTNLRFAPEMNQRYGHGARQTRINVERHQEQNNPCCEQSEVTSNIVREKWGGEDGQGRQREMRPVISANMPELMIQMGFSAVKLNCADEIGHRETSRRGAGERKPEGEHCGAVGWLLILATLLMGSWSVEMQRKNREEQEGLDQMGMRPKKHKESRSFGAAHAQLRSIGHHGKSGKGYIVWG